MNQKQETLRIGVIGVGRIGIQHAGVVAAQEAVGELILADTDYDRAVQAASDLKAKAVKLDDLWGQVDAVVIATPTSTHAELLRQAIRADLAVFCEKPVALDVPTTRAVVAEAAASGLPVQMGFQRRFDVGYVAARQAVRDGSIGALRRAHLLTCDPTPPPAQFIPTSGGLFKDCGIHDVDALRWVTGREVVEVSATGANRGASFFGEAGDVDEALAWLRLDDDTLATLQLSRYNGAGYDVRMEVAGTAGSIAVGLDDHTALKSAEPGVGFPKGPSHPGFYPRFQAAFEAELAAFVKVATGQIESPATPGDALAALLVCEAMGKSRTEGRLVKVAEIAKA